MLSDLLNQNNFILFGHEITNHFTVFGVDIYFYALAIVTGMLVSCLVVAPMFERKGEKKDFILDLMIFIVPLCIIGARLWYVLFDIKTFINSPKGFFLSAINIRDGGLAIYGGVLFGALGVFLACKFRKVNFFKTLDLAACVLPLGQAIGRWGNFFNQEVYGKEITNPAFQWFPLAVQIDDPSRWYQALFFYESVLNLILFACIYSFMWKRRGATNGYAVAFYFIGYGVIRGILEPFRQSEYNLPFFGVEGVRGMIIISALLVVAGLLILLFLLKKDGYIFRKKSVGSPDVKEEKGEDQ